MPVSQLEKLGFNRQIISWCQNYPTDETQSGKTGDISSPRLPIKCGVPQGSILGPLFFIIYVNDLLELFGRKENIHITLYADDTVLYVTNNSTMG